MFEKSEIKKTEVIAKDFRTYCIILQKQSQIDI